jgi:hypothetical protein
LDIFQLAEKNMHPLIVYPQILIVGRGFVTSLVGEVKGNLARQVEYLDGYRVAIDSFIHSKSMVWEKWSI